MVLVRTVYLTSEAALSILFLHFIFFLKRPSNLLFCYSCMEFKIGIMYMAFNLIEMLFLENLLKLRAHSTF